MSSESVLRQWILRARETLPEAEFPNRGGFRFGAINRLSDLIDEARRFIEQIEQIIRIDSPDTSQEALP